MAKIYFAAIDSSGQRDLWVTDGTASGTGQISVASVGVSGLSPSSFAAVGATVFFAGFDGAGKQNLFTLNSTSAAVTELKAANSSTSYGLSPHDVTPYSGKVYFQGQDVSGQYNLFTSDGTAAGTVEVPLSTQSSTSSYPNYITPFAGKLAFGASESTVASFLYLSDGTTSGTSKVAVQGASFVGPSIRTMASLGSKLVFEGANAALKQVLWVSDGTAAGTAQLAVLGLNPSGDYAGAPAGLLAFGSKAAFTAADATGKTGIWVTDGTVAGTVELPGLYGNSYGVPMTALSGGRLAVIANDAAGTTAIWITDGTAANTARLMVAGINAATLNPHAVMAFGNRIVFDGTTGSGVRGLYISDGTTAGTSLLQSGVSLIAGNVDTDAAIVPDAMALIPASTSTVTTGGTILLGTATPGVSGDTLSVTLLSDAAFSSGSTISVDAQGQVQYQPGTVISSKAGPDQIRYRVTDTATGQTVDGAGTPTLQASVADPILGFNNGTTGQSGSVIMDAPAAGGPSYLNWQYINAGSDSIALSTSTPNVFIHSGSGNDAIQVTSGQNVLDGGLGSNFLTGGTGTDTFFTDARNPGVVWNTIRNFHAGDAATLWGFSAGVSSYRWEPSITGAAGSEGATLRANIVGGSGRAGDGIDASITFTGLSVDQAKNLQIVTGTQPAGSYLYLYNPGV